MTLQEIHNKIGLTKYSTLYIKIIHNANNQNRIKLKKDNPNYIYYEEHHILPKSIFKEFASFKENPWNKGILTAREHFICHVLIMKHYRKIENKNGYIKMSRAIALLSKNDKFNSRIYESLKLNLSHTTETKLKISESNKGKTSNFKNKTHTKANKEIISIAAKKQHKEGRTNFIKGHKHSDETKEKLSTSAKNRKVQSRTKLILIFNSKDELVGESKGNFKTYCKDKNFPHSLLKTSYQNNTKILKIRKSPNNWSEEFIGWYAILA